MDSLIDFQAGRIRKLYYEMSNAFSDITLKVQYADDDDLNLQMEIDSLEDNFVEMGHLLYYTCLAYFETLKLPEYLQLFKQEVGSVVGNKIKMLNSDYAEDVFSTFLGSIWGFLQAFPVFHDNDEELLTRTGIVYLEHILASTSVIIRDLGKSPKNEADVYNAVKIVCKASFMSAQFPSEAFVKTAKCYKPDILIPSLKCAVEYKYATDEKELNKTMDEILADVAGYAGNRAYRIFFAVFYVPPGTCIEGRFKVMWEEKEFPDNWKGILVEGL